MLVGRDELVGQLRAELARPGLVVVLGEAGAGKTALVSEALPPAKVARGQCFRSLSWMSGLPLAEALDAPLPPGDPAWIADWVARRLRDRVMVVEDGHWADPLTLRVLGHLRPGLQAVLTVRAGDPGAAAALEAATAAGARTVEVTALADDDARRLLALRRPRLRPRQAAHLVGRAMGNPLLLLELEPDGRASTTLARSVVARIRALGEQAWRSFALLAVAGAPLPAPVVPARSVLRDAGLVVDDGPDRVRARHPLLAEVVAEVVAADPATRAALLGELGQLALAAEEFALAAERFLAAGLTAEALDCAQRALRQPLAPGERAHLLELSARCSSEPLAEGLRLQAVEGLVEAGEHSVAGGLLGNAPDAAADADLFGRWCLAKGRISYEAGDREAAAAAYQAGLEHADPGSATQAALELERVRLELLQRQAGDVAKAAAAAEAAASRAERLGVERARALGVVAVARLFTGRPGATEAFAESARAAANAGELHVEAVARNNLISCLEQAGELDAALAAGREAIARAASLRLGGWQLQFRAMTLNVLMHLGRNEELIEEGTALLHDAVERRTRDQVAGSLALGLIDTGRFDQAEEVLRDAIAEATQDPNGLGNLLWMTAEAAFWKGDPVRAGELGAQAQHFLSDWDWVIFPTVTLAHVARELSTTAVPVAPAPSAHFPIVDGGLRELEALRAAVAGDADAAGVLALEAAEVYSGHHRRGELRCRWLAADVLPAAQDERACELLLHLEAVLEVEAWEPLLRRVRRWLRGRGVARMAKRGRVGPLTTREREVLDLVAAGLSSPAIAARLGVSVSTVTAQIASARARLGDVSRGQAAARPT